MMGLSWGDSRVGSLVAWSVTSLAGATGVTSAEKSVTPPVEWTACLTDPLKAVWWEQHLGASLVHSTAVEWAALSATCSVGCLAACLVACLALCLAECLAAH